MSLESALDEERRAVMDILEGRNTQRSSPMASSSAYGQNGRNSSPVAPVRSMLDIGPAAPRHGSIAGGGVGVTPSPLRSAPLISGKRSMLDPLIPPAARTTRSTTTSPTEVKLPTSGLHRAQSDASSHPMEGRFRTVNDKDKNLQSKYQFDMTSTVSGAALPKRVSLGGKKNKAGRSAMASIVQDQVLDSIPPRDSGRHNSTASILGGHSRSPSSRLNKRSQSPSAGMLNTNSFNPMSVPGTFVTDSGKVIDMNSAYRRLSDAALLNSGGNLSLLPKRNSAARARAGSGEVLSPAGEPRLQKDYYEHEHGEGAIESSDEEHSSDDDAWSTQNPRGRRRGRRKKSSSGDADDDSDEGMKEGPVGMGRSGTPRMVRTLMGAAEEERLSIASKYKVKSLLEPTVTVTGPNGERLPVRKAGVHPNTNYNSRISGTSSPATSDSEDISDIRRAQKLSINMSPVDNSIPSRVIRTIIRGEFAKMQQEAEEGSRRLRTYLVATDLSGEAAYALEWTIGTVLRDGDTLLAIYAVDEEVGTGKGGDSDSVHSILPTMDGAEAIQETTNVVDKLTEAAHQHPAHGIAQGLHSPLGGPRLSPSNKNSRTPSADSRYISKAEQERLHAIEDISQTCIKFLRKTRLQVRIAVEVIHCKSPKHMITGAIDGLEPTLVILGSRGRSALKGVLLGSFSNYLVAKSSVPVMVARKKLQKPNAKNKLPHIRLANNLTPMRSLAEAKID